MHSVLCFKFLYGKPLHYDLFRDWLNAVLHTKECKSLFLFFKTYDAYFSAVFYQKRHISAPSASKLLRCAQS